MNRFLKRLLIILAVVAVALFLYSHFVEDIFSKRLSPKDAVKFELNDTTLEVMYNRPFKKGREIFGALVPYDKVWRTGANEATTFTTNKNLLVDGQALPVGTYTLWTVPRDSVWIVYFNTKEYPWGVDEQMQPMREPRYDLLEIEVPVIALENTVEQFTIAFDNTTDNLKLTMAWDHTKVEVPMEVSKVQPE
ncbi:DUF2911 domain-containing protein [Gelidibacter salicanalis]|uniref:DUF2911 domain-containing protein n=1 Tax=Gelidibacter salicanalis TaxID=291193 RepID=A0A934KHX8_9FLAO|nr:DUF2911 domain-containing protein [Gelidibacter salicanalis]MBJ7879277.1 DUF2911 domain-containing protein [Gelidibacter salicanalis]